jgi:hypothetical protein
MEIDVARAEAVAAVRRDDSGFAEHAVFERERPQRARIFGLAMRSAVAAVDHHHRAA